MISPRCSARSLSALVDVLRDARALDIAVFSLSDDHPPGRRDLPQSEGEEQGEWLMKYRI